MRRTLLTALALHAMCNTSCIDVSVTVPPENIAVRRAWEAWDDAGLPDVSGCVAGAFVLPAAGPVTFARACITYQEGGSGCVVPFNGSWLIVVAPGIPEREHWEPTVHQALHMMTACTRIGHGYADVWDLGHKDDRVWNLEVRR